MSATVIKVDGKPVSFPRGVSFELDYKMGFLPTINSWELPVSFVNDLVAAKAGQEIEVIANGKTFKRLVVVGNAPSGNPQTSKLLLADVRWWLLQGYVVRDANARRRVGDTRLVGDGPLQGQTPVDTVRYLVYSLSNNSIPFTWLTLFQNVAAEAFGGNPSQGRPIIEWKVDEGSFALDGKTTEETYIDDYMPTGIARTVMAMPGRSLCPDKDGVIHVVNAVAGTEKSLLDPIVAQALDAAGSLRFIDMRARRPKNGYHALFDPEIEVLCSKTQSNRSKNEFFMENVLCVPDVGQVDVSGKFVGPLKVPAMNGNQARSVGPGSYLTMAEAFAAWGPPLFPSAFPSSALNDDRVRCHFLGSDLDTNYVWRGQSQPDSVWSARIAAVMRDYRTLWRINPTAWSAVRSAKPFRVAVWDTVTASRAPSPVFCDHAMNPTQRAQTAALSLGTKLSYNAVSYNPVLSKCRKAAQARLVIEDFDQGIVRFVWEGDASGQTGAVAPSATETVADLNPANDPSGAARSILWPSLRLVADSVFQCSTIITCVPAGPNDARRLYDLHVNLSDILFTLASKDVTASNIAATGPDQSIRIPPSPTTTALIAWTDDPTVQAAILGSFAPAVPNSPSAPSISQLTPYNLQSTLIPLARARCAAHFSTVLDHYQGRYEAPFFECNPIGSLKQVTYRFSENGSFTILTASQPEVGNLDPNAFLTTAARQLVNREVQR